MLDLQKKHPSSLGMLNSNYRKGVRFLVVVIDLIGYGFEFHGFLLVVGWG